MGKKQKLRPGGRILQLIFFLPFHQKILLVMSEYELLNRYSLPRFAVASDSFGLSRPARSTNQLDRPAIRLPRGPSTPTVGNGFDLPRRLVASTPNVLPKFWLPRRMSCQKLGATPLVSNPRRMLMHQLLARMPHQR